jgi:hypothetical protein
MTMKPPSYHSWLPGFIPVAFNKAELEMPDAGNLGAMTKAMTPIFLHALSSRDS